MTTTASAAPEGGERRRALTGGFWNAATTVLPMGSALLLSIAIGRTLGEDALGSQSYIAYLSSLLVSLLIMSTVSASLQTLGAARGRGAPGEVAALARLSNAVHLGAGTLAALALLVIGLARGTEVWAWSFAALTTAVDGLGWAMSSRIVARDGWSAVARRRIVSQVGAPLLGLLALVLGLGIPGVFAAQTIASLVLVLALRPVLARAPIAADAAPVRPALAPLAALWGMNVLSGIVIQVVERRLEVVFLDAFSPVAQIAMYSVAFNLVSIAYYVCSAGVGAAIPSIAAVSASGDRQRVVDSLRRSARLVVVVSTTLAAAIAAVGPALISWVYGSAFDPAAALVPWLCLSLLLAPLGHLTQSYWTGLSRLAPVIVSGAVGGAVDIGVALATIPSFGARGAVAANVAGQCVAAAVVITHTVRRTGSLGVPVGLVARLAAVLVPAAVVGRLAADLHGPLGTFAGAAAFLAVALVATRVVRVLDVDDVRWLENALPGRAARAVAWLGRSAPAAATAGAGGGAQR